MCGRFSINSEKEYLEQRFKASFRDIYVPNSNASPGQMLPVIKSVNPEQIDLLKWGLKPVWLDKLSGRKSSSLINVRDDNLRLKKTFEKDLLNRRCLILADGFYEWKKINNAKMPYFFHLDENEPFAMAGIWEENKFNNGEIWETFAIVTTEANKDVKGVHDRMPVILEREEEEMWLGNGEKNDFLSLLDPLPPGVLEKMKINNE